MDYDIFLSYRRDGGAPMAQLLYTKLTDAGYRVFIDLEEMQQGDSNEQLLTVIENAKDIVLILSPGALDRCVNEGDGVRRELCHALQHGKNIVTFMDPGFRWPKDFPQDLTWISELDAVTYSQYYFDASLQKLESFLLSSKHPTAQYDVFLSYRRGKGAALARLVYGTLKGNGYRVFLDVVDMKQGSFIEQLLSVIKNANDIVLLLSPGALDRCDDEKDWVRRELCQALDHGKHIVTYMDPGFTWPDNLPQELVGISGLDAVTYSHDYFDASVQKLESYLRSIKHPHEEKTAELIPAQAELIEDDDSLEPEIEIHIEEPIKKGFLGAKYSSEQIRSIRDDNRAQIIASLEEIKNLLSLSSIPSRRAYKNAASALILVRDQLGHYTFWGMDIDQAIVSFEKNYTDNVEKIRICARKGNVYLTEACRKELQQMAVGLETIIRILG